MTDPHHQPPPYPHDATPSLADTQPAGAYPPPATPAASNPPRKRNPLLWIAGGAAVLLILCCGIGTIGAAFDDNPGTKPATTASATTPAPSPTTAASSSPASPTPAATTAAPTPVKTTPPAKPKPVVYAKLTDRQWKLIAKNPDEHIGKTYIVYGEVTQFDAATGDDSFRANVGARNMQYGFEYDTNTLLNGDASRLRNLVEGDEFQAKVTVMGSFSYDTQIGGSTTVPLLRVDSVKVL